MNHRLLGTLCSIGGAAYLLNGLRFLIAGGPASGWLDVVLSSIWALGGISGVAGMVAARATGANRVVRVIAHLPALAFVLVLTGNLSRIADPASEFNPLIAFGLLGLVIGMVLNGVFVAVARVWRGWKRVVPFLPAIMPFVGMAIGALIGIQGGVNVSLVALSWMLLGYAVSTSPAPAIAYPRANVGRVRTQA